MVNVFGMIVGATLIPLVYWFLRTLFKSDFLDNRLRLGGRHPHTELHWYGMQGMLLALI